VLGPSERRGRGRVWVLLGNDKRRRRQRQKRSDQRERSFPPGKKASLAGKMGAQKPLTLVKIKRSEILK